VAIPFPWKRALWATVLWLVAGLVVAVVTWWVMFGAGEPHFVGIRLAPPRWRSLAVLCAIVLAPAGVVCIDWLLRRTGR
jgi:hypothetical protein